MYCQLIINSVTKMITTLFYNAIFFLLFSFAISITGKDKNSNFTQWCFHSILSIRPLRFNLSNLFGTTRFKTVSILALFGILNTYVYMFPKSHIINVILSLKNVVKHISNYYVSTMTILWQNGLRANILNINGFTIN